MSSFAESAMQSLLRIQKEETLHQQTITERPAKKPPVKASEGAPVELVTNLCGISWYVVRCGGREYSRHHDGRYRVRVRASRGEGELQWRKVTNPDTLKMIDDAIKSFSKLM